MNYLTPQKSILIPKIYIKRNANLIQGFCVLNQFVNFLIVQYVAWWGQAFNNMQDWTTFKTQMKEYGVKWKM